MHSSVAVDKVIQISDFKRNPAHFLEEVRKGTPITITQGRRADTIIVSREEWARLLNRVRELEDELEGLELLAEPTVIRRLRKGLPARGIPLRAARAVLRGRSGRSR